MATSKNSKTFSLITAILPVLALFGAYWYIGVIPVYYVYYPKLSVYSEAVTLLCIAGFILTFFAVAVGVFQITKPKHLGLLFLLYQPIKIIVDLTSLLYENRDLGYIFRSVTFVTMFVFLGASVIVLKNKKNGIPLRENLSKFLIRCIPISLICILIPVLENAFAPQFMEVLLASPNNQQYSVDYIFNSIIVPIMAVSLAVIAISLAIFVQLNGTTFDDDDKLFSAKTLKCVGVSVLCSIAIVIIWCLVQ